jgi:hypothetical protein
MHILENERVLDLHMQKFSKVLHLLIKITLKFESLRIASTLKSRFRSSTF